VGFLLDFEVVDFFLCMDHDFDMDGAEGDEDYGRLRQRVTIVCVCYFNMD